MIMKKNSLLPAIMVLFALTMCFLLSCKKDIGNQNTAVITPLNNGTNVRNLILVISDLHLGADARYQECNVNRTALIHFLEEVRKSPNVKELVIAGDFFDEWFVPSPIDTYQGADQDDFVERIVSTNRLVFDAFQNIINDGKILVTYVPGNHDLTIADLNVEKALPGINQVRDEGTLGLGSYSSENYSEIVIEHGHRYNFFCAPDPISNQSIAPGTILPPGYFFTRIAALHLYEECFTHIDTLPVITPNSSGETSQSNLYNYWQVWSWAINSLPIARLFNDKHIITNVNGFTDTFCVNDIVPYQVTPGGTIQVNLYDGIQDNWETRCNYNHVNVPIPTNYAINNASTANATDTMAYWQYFNNPSAGKRIVVFGHSHVAKLKSYSISGIKYIYANSGAWIDHNPLSSRNMNFVIITPQSSNPNSQTYVRVYDFQNEIMSLMAEDSLVN